MYSGGKDSVSTAHYISENYPDNFAGVVFTNTGIGSNVTRKFVLEYCREMNWPLIFTWAKISYYDSVMEYGFPGAGSHRLIMGYLKYHSWYWFLRDKLKTEKACFISGVRKKESTVRDKKRFYTRKPIDTNGKIIFAKPFLYKNGSQLMEYFIKNGLKKSPAYDYFDKSGECWCGCFTHEWELKLLEKHDPQTFQTIKWLEKQVQLHGTTEAKKHPYWGRGSGVGNIELQKQFSDFEINDDYCGESCDVN